MNDDGQIVYDVNKRDSQNRTPCQALVPVNINFQDIPVRVVLVAGKKMIPVVDIARSLKIPRNTITGILKDPLLADKQGRIEMQTTRGVQKLVCVTNHGAVGLLYKINSKLSEDEETKQRILKFQNWATETVEEKMQTKLPIKEEIAVKEDWSSVAISHIRLAKEIAAQNPSLDSGMCLAIGIRQAEKATGMDLSAYKRLIPPAPVQFQEEYITASQIARELGNNRTAIEVNRYLHKWGFLYQSDDGTYYLTNAGAEHGKVFPGAFNSGHNGYYIKWKRSIISAAKMRENSPHRIMD
jgi:hypothetical protein